MANYCTVDELRTQINKIGTTGTGSDDALELIIKAVSNAIDQYCNRPDGFIADDEASARVYAGAGRPYLLISECVEITLVSVKGSPTADSYDAWSDDDWIAYSGDKDDPDFNSIPYSAIMTNPAGSYSVFTDGKFSTRGGFRPSSGVPRAIPTVQVTAKWGYSVLVPDTIKQLCIALSARFFKQGEGAWGDTLASADLGQIVYQQFNRDLQFLLQGTRFVKPAVGRW